MSAMTGKVVLITGASSGVGWATAKAFAANGASVVTAARGKDELVALAEQIEKGGGKANYVVTDVCVAGNLEGLVAHAIEKFGRLDCAVNNAGYEGEVASITELSE